MPFPTLRWRLAGTKLNLDLSTTMLLLCPISACETWNVTPPMATSRPRPGCCWSECVSAT